MKFDAITIGGATEDITFNTEEGVLIDNRKDVLRQKLFAFEYGAKVKINDAFSTFGGGAANSAVCLARLGFNVATIICLGNDDRGRKIKDNLSQNGVATSQVRATDKKETGFSLVLVGKNNEHIVFSNRGSNTELVIKTNDIEAMKQTDWLYITSLSGKWEQVLNTIFKIKEPKIAWNPGHIQLNSGVKKIGKFLQRTDFLIVNKDEAIELAMSDSVFKKKPLKFINEIDNLLKIIKSFGPKLVVITNGKFGAHAYDGEKIYFQPIVKNKKIINTTGVGDAFGSSFIAGWEIYKSDIKKSLFLSAKNSARVVSSIGAQAGLLYKKDIK